MIKIINPKNNETIVLKNIKRIKYPDFYKILITKPVAEKLNLDPNLPLLEIIEVKKNKSFVAEKAKIYNEEKKIPSKHLLHQFKFLIFQKINQNLTKKLKKYLYM